MFLCRSRNQNFNTCAYKKKKNTQKNKNGYISLQNSGERSRAILALLLNQVDTKT